MSGAKFKQTEIGLIPEGWECVRFGDIIDFLPNNTLSRECLSNEGAVKNIHYGDVLINYGNVLDASSPAIPCIDNKKFGSYKPRRIAQDGDIIIADTAEDETVCKATELWNVGQNKVVSGLHTMWCRPKNGMFAIKYLGYFVNSPTYHNQVLPIIQGIKVSSVSKKDIKETWVLVPPLEEQKRIASALSSVDELLASLDKQIAKTRDIKQGVIQRLPKGPKCLPLGDISEVKRGVRVVRSQLGNGEYPVYQNSLVPLGYYDKFNCLAGTPFVIAAGAAGEIGYSKTNFWAADDCYYFVCSEGLSNAYLYYFLLSQQSFIGSQVRKASIPRLNHSIISNLLVPMLPIDEQKHIAGVLTSFDATIEGLEAKRQKYESIKTGMMQQLLTGTIRLS